MCRNTGTGGDEAMRRRMYISGAVLFALVALLFVVILLGPDRYSKDGYIGMTIWAAAMSGIGFLLARNEGKRKTAKKP
jgi:hypothetical protein